MDLRGTELADGSEGSWSGREGDGIWRGGRGGGRAAAAA